MSDRMFSYLDENGNKVSVVLNRIIAIGQAYPDHLIAPPGMKSTISVDAASGMYVLPAGQTREEMLEAYDAAIKAPWDLASIDALSALKTGA